MMILKEIRFDESPYIAQVVLENNVILNVRSDGSADGSDGKIYYNISKEVGDDLITVGWSCEAKKPTIL